MKILVTGGMGKPTEKNPFFKQRQIEYEPPLYTINEDWKKWEAEHPSLPALNEKGETVEQYEGEAELVWQGYMWDNKIDDGNGGFGWEHIFETNAEWFNKHHDTSGEIKKTRQVYRIQTAQPQPSKKIKSYECLNCGWQSSTKPDKSKCPDCHCGVMEHEQANPKQPKVLNEEQGKGEERKPKTIVGEDMICPITKEHCDDECCTVGSECNLSPSEDISSSPAKNLFEICLDKIAVVATQNGSITIKEIRDICTPILNPYTSQKGA